jgi:hypothetical protein
VRQGTERNRSAYQRINRLEGTIYATGVGTSGVAASSAGERYNPPRFPSGVSSHPRPVSGEQGTGPDATRCRRLNVTLVGLNCDSETVPETWLRIRPPQIGSASMPTGGPHRAGELTKAWTRSCGSGGSSAGSRYRGGSSFVRRSQPNTSEPVILLTDHPESAPIGSYAPGNRESTSAHRRRSNRSPRKRFIRWERIRG